MSVEPVIEHISLEVEGNKDASPFYRELFQCAGPDGKVHRFRVIIEPRVGDRYVDAWSVANNQWQRVHWMKWTHPLAEVKAAEDLYQGGKYQASDFKACRDELVRVALAVVCG